MHTWKVNDLFAVKDTKTNYGKWKHNDEDVLIVNGDRLLKSPRHKGLAVFTVKAIDNINDRLISERGSTLIELCVPVWSSDEKTMNKKGDK